LNAGNALPSRGGAEKEKEKGKTAALDRAKGSKKKGGKERGAHKNTRGGGGWKKNKKKKEAQTDSQPARMGAEGFMEKKRLKPEKTNEDRS